MKCAIVVKGLTKSFVQRTHLPGVWGSIRSLFSRATRTFTAVQDLSFAIEAGEKVAFIGPNGAGKSTTIKILTGILYPSSGSVLVLGLVPWHARQKLAFQIGTLFGQRSKLIHQLSALDTFSLFATIYEIPKSLYKARLKELIDIFEIDRLLDRPVNTLSLGERMRCELVASLLHKPRILFLDEPTIGLDLNAKMQIRNLLNRLVAEEGTTLFLTSHDTMDIERVASRVIILDQGSIICDSSIQELKRTHLKKKVIKLVTDEERITLDLEGVTLLDAPENHLICEVDLTVQSIDAVIAQALAKAHVLDITIEDPSMEEIIRDVYA